MALALSEIKAIAKKITSEKSRKNYNGIIKLVNELNIDDYKILDDLEIEKQKRFIVVALFQVFKKLFSRGELINLSAKSSSLEAQQFNKWCRNVYTSFKIRLLSLIAKPSIENSLSLDALDVFMQLLEEESEYFSSKKGAPYFPNKTLKQLILALIESDLTSSDSELDKVSGHSINPLIVEFTEKYYKAHADIQFYFQTEFNGILEEKKDWIKENSNSISLVGKWLTVVNHDQHCCAPNSDLEIFVSNPPKAIRDPSNYVSFYEKNWLLLMNMELSVNQYKTILLILHKRIIPYMSAPIRLMDFLTESYNLQVNTSIQADVVPILALNGLFELIRRFNLEYPNFYGKLYNLITPDLMHVKYRARFFRLMDIFLSSTHLSANLVASFIKKLARFTLDAPPGAIVTVIPFIYNLLKRHPNCMIMLHNPAFISDPFQEIDEIQKLKIRKAEYSDPFDVNETNPELSNAIDSSLWELETLMNHYHPNISSLAKIFSQPFRKMSYNIEDFLDWSYDSLLEAESSRKLKILPTLEYENFDSLFNDAPDTKKPYLTGISW